MITRNWLVVLWCALCGALLVGCPEEKGNGGGDLSSETHWMRVCEDNEACGEGAQCICGRCTLPCDADDACEAAGPLSSCVPAEASSTGGLCEGDAATETTAGICLAPCDSVFSCGDVSASLSCQEDVCLPTEPSGDQKACSNSAGCGGGSFCDFGDMETCPEVAGAGICKPLPDVACTEEYDPVCGCDGQTYGNACGAMVAGAAIDHEGECTRDDACPEVFDPVCGADGQTYNNRCEADAAGVEIVSEGECSINCPEIYEPVCGEDGQTYDNRCEADRAGVDIISEGACRVVCDEVVEPVCGVDGLTYYNRCEAEQANVEVASEGACDEPCTDEGPAVCGVDGTSYQNACIAGKVGVEVAHDGPCEQVGLSSCGGNFDCGQGAFCSFGPIQCGTIPEGSGACRPVPNACLAVYEPVCGCDGVTYGNACEAHADLQGAWQEGACE